MTGPLKADLFFFQMYFDSWNGRQRWHARPDDVVISTDASTKGAGAGGFAVVVEQSKVSLADGWRAGAGAGGPRTIPRSRRK